MEEFRIQISPLIILLVTGMVLGGFFDLYRVLRSRMKVNPMAESTCDLLFWLGALLLTVPLLYWAVWLEMRLYTWLALFGGLAIYFTVFSQTVIRIWLTGLHWVGWFPRQFGKGLWRIRQLLRRVAWLLPRSKEKVSNNDTKR